MKRILGLLCLLGMLACPALASAEEEKQLGIYIGGHLGASIENITGRSNYEPYEDFSWPGGSDTDTVFGGGLSLGYDFDPQFDVPLRVELVYTARSKAEATSWGTVVDAGVEYGMDWRDKIGLQTLMFNAWFDIPTGTAFTPYIGGGLGFAFIDYKNVSNSIDLTNDVDNAYDCGSSNETNFAWSLGAGLAYDFTENWTLDLGYRYIYAGKVSYDYVDAGGYIFEETKAKVQSHDIMLGIRFTF